LKVIWKAPMNLSVEERWVDLDTHEGFNLFEADFHLGFGNMQRAEVPDTIAYWSVTYETSHNGVHTEPVEYPDHYGCGRVRQAFEGGDPAELPDENLEQDDEDFVYKNLQCSSVFDNEIRGNRYNENFNYIAIKYKKCPEGQSSPSG
jgi:hypothetical protein